MTDNTNDPLNHMTIGKQQELFFFHEFSPGCCFFLPNGTKIYNKLLELIKKEYFKRGFQEVKTPMIFKKELWEISGHWQKYKENMFIFTEHELDTPQENSQIYSNKPMNCPATILIYLQKPRTHKDLPLRIADFGVLHRNELSNSLRNLTRNRSFSQDDAHIFIRKSQINSEIKNCINFLDYIYNIFGLKYELNFSTRPDIFMGDLDLWNEAENQLKIILDNLGKPYQISEKDGAFYGPKIDIKLTDSLGRKHQCGTIQLDFIQPVNFKLDYTNEKGESDIPVIIHRAIFGSFERFLAILIEHYKGKWPFWLNPKQICIITISNYLMDYANNILNRLREEYYFVDIDLSDNMLNKKIRNAQIDGYNYILIIGQKELETNTINLRYRDSDNKKIITIDQLIEELQNNIKNFK